MTSYQQYDNKYSDAVRVFPWTSGGNDVIDRSLEALTSSLYFFPSYEIIKSDTLSKFHLWKSYIYEIEIILKSYLYT